MMNYEALVKKQRAFFMTNRTKTLTFRLEQLDLLEEAIHEFSPRIIEALKKDLRKSEFETYTTEIGFVLNSIRETKKNLRRWMKPKRVKQPIFLFGSRSYIKSEPYGNMLIIGPFNYPFQLSIEPLVGAIAAGNTVVIKPSEQTPRVTEVLSEMIKATFKEEFVTLVKGEVAETTSLLAQRFDFIFFTGSSKVGKIVMEAAAKNLTPVTLELGGKSPAIVTKDASISDAAQKIVWGKFLNTGQTCVAPDYVLVDEQVRQELLIEMKKHLLNFYGENPITNPDYGRLATDSHWERINRLLGQSKEQIIFGGESDAESRYVAPTIVDDVDWNHVLMEEEIFGPILPIISYIGKNIESEVIQKIKERERPLALYLFTRDNRLKEHILNSISFGGGVVNDTIVHLSNTNLPFGGIGMSGIGNYHGKYGFDTFSHQKAIVEKAQWLNLTMLYPPYTQGKLNLIKKVLR